jgi:hypothetical protein
MTLIFLYRYAAVFPIDAVDPAIGDIAANREIAITAASAAPIAGASLRA